MARTQLINRVRGLPAEYDIVLNKGAAELRQKLSELLEKAENGLPNVMRALLHWQLIRLTALDDKLEWYNSEQKNMSVVTLSASASWKSPDSVHW